MLPCASPTLVQGIKPRAFHRQPSILPCTMSPGLTLHWTPLSLFPSQTQKKQNVAELPMLQECPFYSEVQLALSTLIHTKDIKSASHNIIKPAFILSHSRFYRTGAAGFLADDFSAFSIYPNFPEGVCLQGSIFRSSSCIILYCAQFSTNLENLEEIKEFHYMNIAWGNWMKIK